MIAFAKPSFNYIYNVAEEIASLRKYHDTQPGRAVPAKQSDRLLIATWNIANLGLQKRDGRDYQLIAIQEVHDNLNGLYAILAELPNSWQIRFNDRGGNDERAAFIFDSQKVKALDMSGEVSVPPSEHRHINVPGIKRQFSGFDRNPFIYAFEAGNLRFTMANVHLYFGRDNTEHKQRRTLEAYAIARWGDLREKDKHAYTGNIILCWAI